MTVNTTHELKRTMTEAVFYPPHPPRKASAEFEATRKRLIEELDTPCWICGVRQSTLKDATQNKIGASAMELHHWVIEWSLCDAVDPVKVTPEYPDVTDRPSLEHFLDSTENGMVLCDIHHRHTEQGIHALEYPVWRAQRYVKDGYKLTETPNDAKP